MSSPTSGNAADDYRRAFEEIARLPDADAIALGPNDPLPPNNKSEQIVTRLEPALNYLHKATAEQGCDWENNLRRKGSCSRIPTSREISGPCPRSHLSGSLLLEIGPARPGH